MSDKYQELQDRLATVAFLTELLALEDPFKKGIKNEGDSRARVVVAFREFAQKMKDSLLDEQSPVSGPPEGYRFSDEDVLILKAWIKKMSSKPEVQKILNNLSPTQPKKSVVKVLPPQAGESVNKVGKFGKIVDIEDAQGAVGGNVDSGDRFAAIAKHSVQGYYECAVVDSEGNPTGVRFLIHDSLPEWERAK
jgi:hypothetical protein